MTNFIDKWHKIREEKNSNICAWLDPAVFEMWRWEKWLSKWVDKLEWALRYIEAVAPYVSAIKPNAWYYWNVKERTILKKIVDKIHELWLLAIVDSKISDIWSTSDSYIYDYKELGFDALTIAPYAWNIEELIRYWHNRWIAIITMWLMSNPEYRREMNFKNEQGLALWQYRVESWMKNDVDWLVVGWTYKKEDKDFQKFIELTNNSDVLYLVPWIWAQGGWIEEFLSSWINKNKCIINSGRAIMFPNWSNSTWEEQANAAKKLRDAFNN